jgi:uncharacterized protein YecA (UPF0149 family)
MKEQLQRIMGLQSKNFVSTSKKNIPYRKHETPPGRNDLCSCGKGKKYKRCCGKTK